MYMPEVTIRLACPECGSILEIRGSPTCEARAFCRKCGTIVIADINVSIKYDKYDEKMLEEFKWWLVKEKGISLSTATTYVKYVRNWLLEGKYPNKLLLSPINYWKEWRKTMKQ